MSLRLILSAIVRRVIAIEAVRLRVFMYPKFIDAIAFNNQLVLVINQLGKDNKI